MGGAASARWTEASSLRRQSLHQGPPGSHQGQLSQLVHWKEAVEENRLRSLRDRLEDWIQSWQLSLERSRRAGLSTAVEPVGRTVNSGSAYVACPEPEQIGPDEVPSIYRHRSNVSKTGPTAIGAAERGGGHWSGLFSGGHLQSPVSRRGSGESKAITCRDAYCSFAYSTSASFRMGMSGSASFHRVKKSL